ncbi:MAG: type II toxin-antitoxin system VapC family toxin [Candidatus Baldrarchaeia archaeon]
MKAVVDASVVVKWFIPEDYSDIAFEILERYKNGTLELYAPDLFRLEVASALRKYTLRKIIDQKIALESLDTLKEIDIRTINVDWKILEEALRYATENPVTVYDAIYIICTRKINASLITADEKLCNAIKRKEKNVIFIGELGKKC